MELKKVQIKANKNEEKEIKNIKYLKSMADISYCLEQLGSMRATVTGSVVVSFAATALAFIVGGYESILSIFSNPTNSLLYIFSLFPGLGIANICTKLVGKKGIYGNSHFTACKVLYTKDYNIVEKLSKKRQKKVNKIIARRFSSKSSEDVAPFLNDWKQYEQYLKTKENIINVFVETKLGFDLPIICNDKYDAAKYSIFVDDTEVTAGNINNFFPSEQEGYCLSTEKDLMNAFELQMPSQEEVGINKKKKLILEELLFLKNQLDEMRITAAFNKEKEAVINQSMGTPSTCLYLTKGSMIAPYKGE